jgi:hypothetical protein
MVPTPADNGLTKNNQPETCSQNSGGVLSAGTRPHSDVRKVINSSYTCLHLARKCL